MPKFMKALLEKYFDNLGAKIWKLNSEGYCPLVTQRNRLVAEKFTIKTYHFKTNEAKFFFELIQIQKQILHNV